MQKKGKKIVDFYSKMLSTLVSPHSSSSPSTSKDVSFVSFTSRSPSELTVEHNIESAAEIIMKWSTESLAYTEVKSMFNENKQEALQFIKCVNDLQKVMHFLASANTAASEKLRFSHDLMQIAMKRLRIEFYRILSVKCGPLNEEFCSARAHMAGGSISGVKTVSPVPLADLRTIAACMISSGHAKECVEIYGTIRKSIVDEGLYNLGIIKPSHIRKMGPEELDLRIKKWLNAVNVAVTTLFNAERVLGDHIFAACESVRESCFANTCKEGAMLLFAFPEIIVKSKKSQNIFHMLDMFTIISENWLEIESTFSFESTEAVRSQAFTSVSLLTKSISAMLSDFGSSIQKDSSNSLPAASGVHTLALQLMDYLSHLAEYQEALSIIFAQWPLPGKSSLPDSCSNTSDDSPVQAVSSCMAWLIFVLLCKLDCKSRQCNNISQSYLFLANNVRHVVLKVQSSKLQYLLGEEWIARHETKVKHYVDRYNRLAWNKVFLSLPENPSADISTPEVTEVYDNFNSTFKEAYRNQRSSVVSDPKLRDEIVSSIAKSLVSVYREFYNAHRIPMREEPRARFTPEDVENYLSCLLLPVAESERMQLSSSASYVIELNSENII